jgi:TonB family protein
MQRPVLCIAMFLALAIMPGAFAVTANGQQANQLTLADILIALRSIKATLPDRNKLLTEAVINRGTTFALTPEIEKELSGTGADKALLDSIRKRAPIVKVSSIVASSGDQKPETETPKLELPAPPPPDFSYFEKRADDSVTKGDLDAAIADYTKAIELNASAARSLKGRANSYFAKSLYSLAITDLTKVIEIDPKDASVYARRGQAREKLGNAELALEDYRTANLLDATNEVAKAAVDKWRAEQAKATAPPVVEAPAVVPEFVDLGALSEAMATRMVRPVFPATAIQAGVSGQITVYVELDTEGNVTKVRTISGNPMLRQSSEDAARRSKFKPAMVSGKPTKAKGRIIYNFVPKDR